MMRKVSSIRVLQASFAFLLALSLFLHALSSSSLVLYMLHQHRQVSLALLWCISLALFRYIRSRPHRVFMVDCSSFKPDFDQKASKKVFEYLRSRRGRVSPASEQFMKRTFRKPGLGGETYVSPCILRNDHATNLHAGTVEELEQGMHGAVSDLFAKTGVSASVVDHVIVTRAVLSPPPSSMIVNRFGSSTSAAWAAAPVSWPWTSLVRYSAKSRNHPTRLSSSPRPSTSTGTSATTGPCW